MPPDAVAGATSQEIVIEVLRYRSEADWKPVPQVYRVPFTDDMSVLQGLQYIKDHLDGTLSFRWSCRMAICGSCGMMIGGEPKLACMTFLRDYYPGPLTDRAARRIFRSSATSWSHVGGFVKKIESIYPYLIPKTPRRLDEGEYLQTPVAARALRDVQRLHQLHAVLCGLPAVRGKSRLHRSWRDGAAAALQRQLAGWRAGEAHGTRPYGQWRLELHRRRLLLRGLSQASRSRQCRQPEQDQKRP